MTLTPIQKIPPFLCEIAPLKYAHPLVNSLSTFFRAILTVNNFFENFSSENRFRGPISHFSGSYLTLFSGSYLTSTFFKKQTNLTQYNTVNKYVTWGMIGVQLLSAVPAQQQPAQQLVVDQPRP